MDVDTVQWEPGQDVPKIGPDFRSLESTVRGFKIGHSSTANTTQTQPAVLRQKNENQEQQDADEMTDVPVQTAAAPPSSTVPDSTARNVVGVGSKSSRPWKLAQSGRTSGRVRKPGSKSWDEKVRACCMPHASRKRTGAAGTSWHLFVWPNPHASASTILTQSF